MEWIESNRWICLDEDGEPHVVIEETQMHEANPPIPGKKRLSTSDHQLVNYEGPNEFTIVLTGEKLTKTNQL